MTAFLALRECHPLKLATSCQQKPNATGWGGSARPDSWRLAVFRFIECEPDVTRLRAMAEDSFVVMASDGLWDVISDQEAVVIVQVSTFGSPAR